MSIELIGIIKKRKVGGVLKKAILLNFADQASDNGKGIYASKTTIANEVETTRKSVGVVIKELITDKLVVQVGTHTFDRGRTTIKYDLNLKKIKALPFVQNYEQYEEKPTLITVIAESTCNERLHGTSGDMSPQVTRNEGLHVTTGDTSPEVTPDVTRGDATRNEGLQDLSPQVTRNEGLHVTSRDTSPEVTPDVTRGDATRNEGLQDLSPQVTRNKGLHVTSRDTSPEVTPDVTRGDATRNEGLQDLSPLVTPGVTRGYTTLNNNNNKIHARAREEFAFPDDWQPLPFAKGSKVQKIVEEMGAEQFQSTCELFAAHQRKTGKTSCDWQSTWAEWVLYSVNFDPPTPKKRKSLTVEADQKTGSAVTAPPISEKSSEDGLSKIIHGQLEKHLGAAPYRQWIEPCAILVRDQEAIIVCGSAFKSDYIRREFFHTIESVVRAVTHDPSVIVKLSIACGTLSEKDMAA